MKQGICLLLLISIVTFSAGIPHELQWEEFKVKFGKNYRSLSHESERRNIFLSTLNAIEEHNALYEQGLSTYFQGVNFYSDWTWEEFEKTVMMETVVYEDKNVNMIIDLRYLVSLPIYIIFFFIRRPLASIIQN